MTQVAAEHVWATLRIGLIALANVIRDLWQFPPQLYKSFVRKLSSESLRPVTKTGDRFAAISRDPNTAIKYSLMQETYP